MIRSEWPNKKEMSSKVNVNFVFIFILTRRKTFPIGFAHNLFLHYHQSCDILNFKSNDFSYCNLFKMEEKRATPFAESKCSCKFTEINRFPSVLFIPINSLENPFQPKLKVCQCLAANRFSVKVKRNECQPSH